MDKYLQSKVFMKTLRSIEIPVNRVAKNLFSIIINLPILTILLLASSCIGTVKDKNPPLTKGAETNRIPIEFEGVHTAVSIAHDKVDLFFKPAESTSGRVEDLVYIVSYDGLVTPITYEAQSLRLDYKGDLKITVRNLKIDTFYTFQVQVKDIAEQNTSNSQETRSARTFPNLTADFNGVINVKSPPGIKGLDTLMVVWGDAGDTMSPISNAITDLSHFELTVLDAELYTPADMNNENIESPDRKIIKVDKKSFLYEVSGLKSDHPYHFQVRAIHKGFNEFGNDPSYKVEENTNYLTGSTLSADMANLEVDINGLVATRAPGKLGERAVDLSWPAVVGLFDHYRVYYHREGHGAGLDFYTNRDANCNGRESGNSNFFCKRVNFTDNSTRISDLIPYASYRFYLVLCQMNSCDPTNPNENILTYNSVTIDTSPPGADFSGIIDIDHPRNFLAINEIYLRISPPNIESGAIDGLLVEVKSGSPGYSTDTILNHPLEGENAGPLEVGFFDYVTALEIPVSGVSLGASSPYCFSLRPYRWEISEGGGITDNLIITESNIRCINPEIRAPTFEEFRGLTPALSGDPYQLGHQDRSVFLEWRTPTSGIFEVYSLLYRYSTTPFTSDFNYQEAFLGANNYFRINIGPDPDEEIVDFQLFDLEDGYYEFTVRTFFGGGNLYSDPTPIFSLEVP